MLTVNDLYTAYGQSEALHGISFDANANETGSIMGRNGMGKTTPFRPLMGVLPAPTVRITVARTERLKHESFKRVATRLAYEPPCH